MVTVVTIKMTAGAVSKIPSQSSQPSQKGKNRMKSVQIPYDLFVDLVLYHLNGEDDFDEEIRQGLEQKLDAILIPCTRTLPPKKNGNMQGSSIFLAVVCRRAIAGRLLLGSCDRSVPRSCCWLTRQSTG